VDFLTRFFCRVIPLLVVIPVHTTMKECKLFRIHRHAFAPYERITPKLQSRSEIELLSDLRRITKSNLLNKAYQTWTQHAGSDFPLARRTQVRNCLIHYLKTDSDRDGLPDWTAVIDGRLSPTLYPNDEDIDGDGIQNIFDPDPFNHLIRSNNPKTAMKQIPDHLKMKERRGKVQESLYKNFDILAIDQSDDHFKAKVMTIGGSHTYRSNSLSEKNRINVIGILAHEIGHAFLLDQLSVPEVQAISKLYGGWRSAADSRSISSLFDPIFFTAHPLLGTDQQTERGDEFS